MSAAESESRKALNRLRRALEKSRREVEALHGTLCHVEGGDFPDADYEDVRVRLAEVEESVDRECARLQDKVLTYGGLEPGRVRRGAAE